MFVRRSVAIVIAVALAGAPAVAPAQEVVPVGSAEAVAAPAPEGPAPPVSQDIPGAAPDTVLLHGGGVIRGTVAEAFPGRHVTIVSAAGDRHTIAWAQVADVRYGAGPQATPADPPVVPVGPGRPRLHVELSRETTVRLYELTGTILVPTNGWGTTTGTPTSAARPVCLAPCDKVVDGADGRSFFFAGDGVTPSRKFSLLKHDGEMTAVVRPGRLGLFIGGVLFTSLSLAPLLSGAVFLGLRSSSSPTSSLQRSGGVLLGVGAGLLVSGVVMLALGRTRVELYRKVTGASQRRSGPARL